MKNIRRSLADLLGEDYVESVAQAAAALTPCNLIAAREIAHRPVEFAPAAFRRRSDALIAQRSTRRFPKLDCSAPGAATAAFAAAFHREQAPLGGCGPWKLGEDGRLGYCSKSEHYQASLGHNFPGFELLKLAAALGIDNLTHNNTRGHITRVCERELVRTANGLKKSDAAGLAAVLGSTAPGVLNRVINLETGSLATEAGVKMMLARFYRLQKTSAAPEYAGRTPVFFVMADRKGGPEANYHGTTIFTQLFRGLWPELRSALETQGVFKVVPVPPNDPAAFAAAVARYDAPPYKGAGFLHELVLMNYGGVRLEPEYVRAAHAQCVEHNIPVLVDEIQTGIWAPELFLFRAYGLHPDLVAVGKGFPGGQYPASKILVSAPLDNLDLFGALVTNGQEELASLAYLVTMEFAEANAAETRRRQISWRARLDAIHARHPRTLARIEGDGLLTAFWFHDAGAAKAFAAQMNAADLEVSVQTYKADCPPAALMKLPLIVTEKQLRFVATEIENALNKGE